MSARRLIAFQHSSPLGNGPAASLFDRVSVQKRAGDAPARDFSDYAPIAIEKAGLPEGISVLELL